MPAFLDLRTWVDFRQGHDSNFAFHVLVQAIKGEPVGRWPPKSQVMPDGSGESRYSEAARKLEELRRLRAIGEISETVRIEYEQKILDQWLEE